MDEIVSPEIEDTAVPRFLKFQSRQLSVASINDRMHKKQQGSWCLPVPLRGQEERRAGETNHDRQQRDLRWGDCRTRQATGNPQRDMAIDVPRHEPVRLLDE